MFVCPTSSPKITRMFGLPPPAAGLGFCCACATPASASAATNATTLLIMAVLLSLFEGIDPFAVGCWRFTSVASALARLGQLPHHLVEIEARRLLPDRKLLEALQPLRHVGLRRNDEVCAMHEPVGVE